MAEHIKSPVKVIQLISTKDNTKRKMVAPLLAQYWLISAANSQPSAGPSVVADAENLPCSDGSLYDS